MSTSEREVLAETYRGFSDEYLHEQILSGGLTEVAVAMAQQELIRRGLEAPPAPKPIEDEAKFDAPAQEFVTVARFLDPTDAYILQGRLAAQGILAVLADANTARVFFSIAVGGVKVKVPKSQVSAANEIIAAIRSGDLTADDS